MNQLQPAPVTRFRDMAILATGCEPGNQLVPTPVDLLDRLRQLRDTCNGASAALTLDQDLEAFADLLDDQDFAAGTTLHSWMLRLLKVQHEAIISKHGEYFRPADKTSAHLTWFERLQNPLPVAMAEYGLLAGATSITALTACELYTKAGAGAAGATSAATSLGACISSACAHPITRYAVLAGAAVPVLLQVLFDSHLPKGAHFAAIAATNMDQAYEQLSHHILQKYSTAIRQPLHDALDAMRQLEAAPLQREVLVPTIDSNLTEAAAGVSRMIAHINAICAPAP